MVDATKWSAAAESIRNNLDKLVVSGGYFCKGFLLQENGELQYDETIDISSLYGPFMYAGLPLSDERLAATVKTIEERILNSSPAGGVLRYENDNYFLTKHQYKGNPWIVSTLWLAQYYSTAGRTQEARTLLDWSLQRELESGALSEQFDPETAASIGVTPLVWSHAEMVNTLLDLSNKK
jgi:GH15 family glucan-1,4-alpha-glucosidase